MSHEVDGSFVPNAAGRSPVVNCTVGNGCFGHDEDSL